MIRSWARLTPLALFSLAAVVFGLHADPGVGLGDAGELGAAAATFGVAHPTGFPLALVGLHAFEWIPLGPIAFRHALGSGVFAALALAALADAVRIAVKDRQGVWANAGACVAAFGLGAWPNFAQAAIGVEVYSLAVLLFALAAREALGKRRPAVLMVLAGLGLGVHITAVMGIGLMALPILIRRWRRPSWLVPAAMGSAIVAYLPIASARQPAMDWGDPETWGRFVEHITAGRIRGAFAGVEVDRWPFVDQCAELGPWIALAVLGFVRGPRVVRWLLVPLAADLAYSLAINPMGIVDRQVGHVAAACVALSAGIGATIALRTFAHGVVSRALAAAALTALIAASVVSFRGAEGAGWGIEEAFAPGLQAAPPRAVFLCGGSDDGCAVALFERHALGVRPDVDVLVPQHLWEPNERARLGASSGELPMLRDLSVRPQQPNERARLALQGEAMLYSPALGRTLVLQAWPNVRVPMQPMPTANGTLEVSIQGEVWDAVQGFGDLADASRPTGRRQRMAWARQLDTLGRGALGREEPRAATFAYRKAVELVPERSAGWTNLGVALAASGDMSGAIVACASAIERDPFRATAWVNLARYQLASGDVPAARQTLDTARTTGLDDPRLTQLQEHLP